MRPQPLLTLGAIALLLTSPIAMAEQRLLSDYVGVNVGYGWRNDTGEPTFQKCVLGIDKDEQYISQESHARRIESAESLYRDLSISITASAKARFGVGSGGVSASYKKFESSLANANMLNISLTYVAEQNPLRLEPAPVNGNPGTFRLTPEHSALLQKDSKAFQAACGQYFIVAIKRRSIATGLFSMEFRSLEERQRIEKSLGASASYGSVSAKVSVSSISNMLKTEKHGDTSIDFASTGFKLRVGEQAPLNAPATLESFEAFFATISPESLLPIGYAVEVLPYSSLPECAENRARCVPTVPPDTVDPAAVYLERLAALQLARSRAESSYPLGNDASSDFLTALHRRITGSRGKALDNEIDAEYSSYATRVKKMVTHDQDCAAPGSCMRKGGNVDDLRLSLAIPLSRSVVPTPILSRYLQASIDPKDIDNIRADYAVLLWYDRVVRVANARCISGGECIQSDSTQYLCEALRLADVKNIPETCNQTTLSLNSIEGSSKRVGSKPLTSLALLEQLAARPGDEGAHVKEVLKSLHYPL